MPIISFGEYEDDILLINTDHIIEIRQIKVEDKTGKEILKTKILLTGGKSWTFGGNKSKPSYLLKQIQEASESWQDKQAKQAVKMAEDIANRSM